MQATAKNLQQYKNIVKVSLNKNGTIPYEDDWTEYASEIYNAINKVLFLNWYERINVFAYIYYTCITNQGKIWVI